MVGKSLDLGIALEFGPDVEMGIKVAFGRGFAWKEGGIYEPVRPSMGLSVREPSGLQYIRIWLRLHPAHCLRVATFDGPPGFLQIWENRYKLRAGP